MSINWLSDVEPTPALLVRPPAAASLDEAHQAIELWEFYSGKCLDPSQRLTVEVMMAETAGGRWAARTTGREMPRQNGKGDEVEVVELWGLTQRGEAIAHTAHELPTVSSAYQRMLGLFGHRDLARKKARELNGLGQQMIQMHNGGIINYRTRTSGGLRGLDDISRLVVDEAQHANPEQLASATPTLLANPNPQMNFMGTGGIAGVSAWWWEMRIRALAPDAGDFGYVGHTAERLRLEKDRPVQTPVDVLDRANWLAANPVLHTDRGDMGFFEEQLRVLGPAKFAREHLGVWDPPPLSRDGDLWLIVDHDAFEACKDPQRTFSGRVAYALAVDADDDGVEWASVGASDGDLLEVVTPPEVGPGVDWVVTKCVERRDRFDSIHVRSSGPSAKLIDPLRRAGLPVAEVTTNEYVRACGQFADAVDARGVHWNPDAPGSARLVRALARGVPNVVQDGAWILSRSESACDVSPAEAVIVAAWAAKTAPPPPTPSLVLA